MASKAPPNYYNILQVDENASAEQIRAAYKRNALKTHPDRVDEDSPERPVRTRKFQLVNDAYYTLYNPTRRREYDSQRRMFGFAPEPSSQSQSQSKEQQSAGSDDSFPSPDEEAPQSGPGFGTAGPAAGAAGAAFSWAWNYFTSKSADAAAQSAEEQEHARRNAEEAQFGDVFEEMLREEGLGPDDEATKAAAAKGGPLAKFWSMVGGLSGGALGFIVANVPGLVAGAVAGNRLGAIRDTKGKSVYSVFQELPQADRTRLLGQLAARVFSHAVGM